MAAFGVGRSVVYRRIGLLVDWELLRPVRLLHARPALLVATREGLRFAGLGHLDVCHVGVATANHWARCAQVAVALMRSEPAHRVRSERELRAAELARDVRYYADAHVARAVRRAADRVHATEAVDVRSLDELLREVRHDLAA